MIFKEGDWVYYKKYKGQINIVWEYNKSYMVTLYDYRGFSKIDKQINQYELFPAEIPLPI